MRLRQTNKFSFLWKRCILFLVMDIHIYLYTYTHIHVHIHTLTETHTHIHTFIFVWVLWYMHRCLWSPEESIWSPRTGVIGDCELPDMGAGNQTDPLEEQCACRTAELSLQTQEASFWSSQKRVRSSGKFVMPCALPLGHWEGRFTGEKWDVSMGSDDWRDVSSQTRSLWREAGRVEHFRVVRGRGTWHT